jgi:hypothetical protein
VVSVQDKIEFSKENTYVRYSTGDSFIEVVVEGNRGLSIGYSSSYGGGNLHGVWYSDNLVHTSDKRLKTNIQPLVETLNDRARAASVEFAASSEDGAAWVLRELRPVSYRFKKGAESKLQRFGFVADEVEATIPQVVRRNTGPDAIKGIAYQDLIAVLAAALQSLQRRVEGAMSAAMREAWAARAQESELRERLQARLEAMEEGLKQLQSSVLGLTKVVEEKLGLPLAPPPALAQETRRDSGLPAAQTAAREWTGQA